MEMPLWQGSKVRLTFLHPQKQKARTKVIPYSGYTLQLFNSKIRNHLTYTRPIPYW